MASHRDFAVATATALMHNPPLMFLIGVLLVLGGIAWILVHNQWSGGSHAVLVTVLGWVTLLKGFLFLFSSPEHAASFYLGTLHYARMFYWYAGLSALIGAWLCYGGFRPARS